MKRLLCAVLCFAVMLSATACHASETEASSGNASDFIPNPRVSQTIYFWDEGNMPAVTDASTAL